MLNKCYFAFFPDGVLYLPYLPSRNMGGGLLSDLHSGATHHCDFIHISPLSAFIFMISPPSPLRPPPGHCPWQQRPVSSLGPNRAGMTDSVGDDGHMKIHSQTSSSLSALRPDMKGLFREMQRIVIRAFLLLIMILPEPKEREKIPNTLMCYLL